MPAPRLDPNAPLYILLNAASGSRDGGEARSEMEQVLGEARRPFEILEIEHPSRIAETARRAVELARPKGGAIVAAGGDGTINAIAQVVLPAGPPFGIVPQGTFNYSSRAHSIPLTTVEATRALLSAEIRPVQVGAVNDRIFLVNASLGLYPELLQDREQYKQRYGRKRVVALWAGLGTLMREHRQLLLELEHDSEREIMRTPTLFVGNNPLQLEQVGLPEAEDVGQWRLAAVLVKPVSTAQLLWLALRGALGRLGDEERVRNFAFRTMMVRPLSGVGRRGLKVALDGEIEWMQPPLVFSIAPRPLYLMVPASGGKPQ
jgi:diacylglycerol kinase family enzyme